MGGPELKEPIEKIAAEKKITIPMTFLPGGPKSGDIAAYKINPETKNTILLWRRTTLRQSLTDVEASKLDELEKAMDELVK